MADEFFVGWLPTPPGYARFVRPVVLVALLGVAVAAGALAARQRSPGPAVWDDTASTFEGVANADPYPLIRVPGEQPGEVRTILLVEDGKFGAAERVRPFAGRPVRVTGTLLHRDERWMLELAAGDDGLRPAADLSESLIARLRRPPADHLGPVTLHGEAIDSKCYLGAMRPGGGKTHKACAALCLAGGVPPMFVTRGPDGREAYYLLTAADGGPANDTVRDFVGDPVEVSGALERVGGVLVLKLGAIRRR
jgi:hypothetical protein